MLTDWEKFLIALVFVLSLVAAAAIVLAVPAHAGDVPDPVKQGARVVAGQLDDILVRERRSAVPGGCVYRSGCVEGDLGKVNVQCQCVPQLGTGRTGRVPVAVWGGHYRKSR